MKTISIRNKIYLILTCALIGLFILVGSVFYFLQKHDDIQSKERQIGKIVKSSKESKYLIADIRKHEQDFFRKPTNKKETATLELIDSFEAELEHLKTIAKNEKATNTIQKLHDNIGEYRSGFDDIASTMRIIGYTQESGYQGKMFDSFHSNARLIETIDDYYLSNLLLSMNNDTHSYLIDHNMEFYNVFQEHKTAYITYIEQAVRNKAEQNILIQNIENYENGFEKIKVASTKIESQMETFSEIALSIESISKAFEKELLKREQEQQLLLIDAKNNLKQDIFVMIMITIVVILAIGLWLVRSIVSSISILEKSSSIIGNGDLSYRIQTIKDDEMGNLSKTFNHMADKMQTSLKGVLSISSKLTQSSTTLASNTEETMAQTTEIQKTMSKVSEGSNEQANEIKLSETLLETVKQSIQETYTYNKKILEQFQHVQLLGDKGVEQMNRLKEITHSFSTTSSILANRIHDTTETMKEIESVTTIMETISNKTKLLSINARIEAAHAGEHARGFGVVAREVKSLADQSDNEVNTIRKKIVLIDDFMKELRSNAQSILDQKEVQIKTLNETEKSFQVISENIKTTKHYVAGLKTEIDKIKHSNDSVIEKIYQINTIASNFVELTAYAKENTNFQQEAINDITDIAQELRDYSIDLQSQVETFTL